MAYTHVTSPLRRYADLVTQRVIFAHLDGLAAPYSATQLDTIAMDINAAVEERRQRRSEHFKEASRKEGVSHILRGSYATLDQKQWRRMLDLMTKVAPSSGIEDELNRRLDEDLLTPNDLARVATGGPAWIEIQKRLYPRVRERHPEFGPSAVSGWAQITAHPAGAAVFEEFSNPYRLNHQSQFAIPARIGDLVGPWQVADAKKPAQTQAMWGLLAVINGHRESIDEALPPWAPAPAARKTPPPRTDTLGVGDAPDSQIPAASERAHRLPRIARYRLTRITDTKRARAFDNPVSWIDGLASTYALGSVAYTYVADGPPHAPTFICTVTLAGYSATQQSTTKTSARVGAAAALIEYLLLAAERDEL